MRGHWESTTRKLNKHYQSSRKGQGGIIPPVDPFRLTFGDFYTGGIGDIPMFSIPEEGDIPVYPSGYGETYSFMYGAANNATYEHGGDGNFASAMHWEGLRNLDHHIFVVPISRNNYENYNRPTDPDRYPIYQRAQALYSMGKAAKNLEVNASGSIWIKYRERYVRFTFPERYYSPCYYKDAFYFNAGLSFIGIYNQDFPIDTKFELSAKSCKAATYPSVNTTVHKPQSVTLAQYNINNTNIKRITYDIGYSDVVNIYDKELNGESYIDITISSPDTTFYLNNDRAQGYKTDCRKARIYCFIHDNSYYVEQVAHIYDSNDNEITDVVVNLDYLNYPVPIYPYFLNSAFVQPMGTYPDYPYPLGKSRARSDGTYDRYSFVNYPYSVVVDQLLEKNEYDQLILNHVYEDATAPPLPKAMMMDILSDTEFWNKHNEWCDEHGGTPYVPPVVTP